MVSIYSIFGGPVLIILMEVMKIEIKKVCSSKLVVLAVSCEVKVDVIAVD